MQADSSCALALTSCCLTAQSVTVRASTPGTWSQKHGAQVFEATKGFAEHLGKTVSLSLDRPGFIVNRILMPMINEAFFVLMEARTAISDPVKG